MKKLLFPTILITGVFAVVGSMKSIYVEGSDTMVSTHVISQNYSAKYKDCIDEQDFPENYTPSVDSVAVKRDWDITKVNASIQKYGKSMDSTVKSLNAIDAHDFIHKEFQRSKNILADSGLSEIRKHYHCEIMRICYDSDRSLNESAFGR
ncbi:hypothetical protein [Flagellimonas zhangzhouensis]|uniref:Uncharacterized protein n=1 Tax=Flagellimonas zhangzhouensis TaxID=1073328 RepID=A0A1H2Q7M6_9FLAO|nr:hypothetical protein [Allomuricauda zhangzhouensis]SDQ49730.1 hypothetical protein SAMN05216294_1459 [Allomuricauda zhangzhouensis]SDW03176.1 hypothetical protein SAMN04487892_0110 [Allomuricauda zhangzhouensis]